MKKIIILTFIISSFTTVAQGKLPIPPISANHLFYIQRSNNAHTVMYEANLENKGFNTLEPVHVYWIRYDEKVHRQNLSLVQKKLAYGVETLAIKTEKNAFDVRIVAFKKRGIKVKTDEKGTPLAIMTINGIESQLNRIFVQLEDNESLCPKVKYIELFGKCQRTGKATYERFKP